MNCSYIFIIHWFNLENNSSSINKKQKTIESISREELLQKLHEKMPHRQQQASNYI